MIFVHGAGFSALSFAQLAKRLSPEMNCLAIDLPAHGRTMTSDDTWARAGKKWEKTDRVPDLSIERLTCAVRDVALAVLPARSTVFLAGHSMGGGVVAAVAHDAQFSAAFKLGMLILIDVTEGVALAGLAHMPRVLMARPPSFGSFEDVVAWAKASGTVRDERSARISCRKQNVSVGGRLVPRTDLAATAKYWEGWFLGMNERFLGAPCAGMLLSANPDRLDLPLTISHMEGRFELEIVRGAGHTLHEDQATQCAVHILTTLRRRHLTRDLARVPFVPGRVEPGARPPSFEEVAARDHAAALEVYDGGLAVVPYRRVQFPQLWIEAARCALRGGDLAAARRRFGLAIARCPCSEVFDAYVALETDLGNAGRVRTILQRRLEIFPREAKSWVLVARHEAETDQRERERAVLELAAAESATLDFPDVIWKHLLEMEMRRGDTERVRAVYERLCAQSLAARAWISWAQFEASQGDIGAARRVFEEAEGKFRAESTPITGENEAAAAQVRSERAVALGAWLELEEAVEDEAELARVRALQPRVVQVQRPVAGVEGVLEECEDFVFPEMDEEAGGGQRIAGIAESMGGLDDLF
eukprot:gnl/Chilomastix_cuspidata/1815.p1 GENE.gnl/Chilomastix_cuspidata/1815~~gnl/Chilomastix_cuspidata/1815.p1  ORF type:complete len:664 (-),score=302.62 gnl/Chilomastix_cuspidata/1815:61-1824(-)